MPDVSTENVGNRAPSDSVSTLRDGRRSLSVTDRLREEILGGVIACGERLNEVRLSQLLEVSRTPVRAALPVLAGERLLDYVPNRRFQVRAFPISEAVHAYDIRGQLEGLATRFAAERGLSTEDRAVIEQSLREGDALWRTRPSSRAICRSTAPSTAIFILHPRCGQEPNDQRNDPHLLPGTGVLYPEHRWF